MNGTETERFRTLLHMFLRSVSITLLLQPQHTSNHQYTHDTSLPASALATSSTCTIIDWYIMSSRLGGDVLGNNTTRVVTVWQRLGLS